MYDHVFPDLTEIKTNLNQNQTIIRIVLHKQTQTTWPQLNSSLFTPITPEQKEATTNLIDQQIHSTIEDEKLYEIQIKKTLFQFNETPDGKATVEVMIENTRNCQIQFTETNFTISFYSKFEDLPSIDYSFIRLSI